jgi:malic enzyme
MSAQRNPDPRQTDTTGVQYVAGDHTPATIEHASVRILFDGGGSVECACCGSAIEQQTRYRHLIVRDQEGTIEEHSICSDECRPQHS